MNQDNARTVKLPECITPGGDVWMWDTVECRDELCIDSVSCKCAINQGLDGLSVRRCCARHLVLRHLDVWSVYALFLNTGGVAWVINDCYTMSPEELERRCYATEAEAVAHRPEMLGAGI